ncbi:MAG TPA: M23 family metallopeptidase [Ohtaekwangia sp.]
MKLSSIRTILGFVLIPFISNAQFSEPEVQFSKKEKPNGEEYLYPVNPGQPGSLAGTMGELRTTHFHSGIDIRTNNMIGFPVLASKSGYVTRATISNSGYGNVIYITHPDGNTTLYGHLDKFTGELADYVLGEQYRRHINEIDLFFGENQFMVKQGQVIAYSGNSGGSTGPHLHFDIRDANNFALDPLKVADFPEIVDNLPPAAEKIALRTLDVNSRINDQFGRYEFYGNRVGNNNFVIASPILASGSIGIEILAKDKLAYKSPFYGGVNYLELWVDSAMVFRQSIEKLDLAETRTIYTLMDFKTMRNKGTRFYKLYIDDGNDLKFYGGSPTTGKIRVNPNKLTDIQIRMKDSYGNSSSVSFKLQPNPIVKEVPSLEAMPASAQVISDLTENTLKIIARPTKENTKASVYVRGNVTEIEPAYYNNNRRVYLLDLRKSIPDSISVGTNVIKPNIKVSIPSGTEYKYYSDYMDVQFPLNAIYDTLYLNTNRTVNAYNNEVFTIGDRTVPLNKSIGVSLKTARPYPAESKYAVYRMNGRSFSFIGGEWLHGRINFSTRELGDFIILKDSIPPTIKPIYVSNQAARFKIKDNLSGIAKYEATLNGQWLLMLYDSKIATIWSERKDKSIPLKGDLELVVTDNSGNKTVYKQKIP